MTDRHAHDWRRDGPLQIRNGGVRERCACGKRRLRKIVRCPDCAEARFAAKVFSAERFPCETCAPPGRPQDGRGWVDAPAPVPTELCCCHRFATPAERCQGCREMGGGRHVCLLMADEADAAYRERQADALLDPPAPKRPVVSDAARRAAHDMGF